MPSVAPSAWAVVRAIAIGVFIPLISSIIPIRRALSTNLTEALNVNRSKSSAVLISFIDNQTKDVIPYLIFGTVAAALGVAVYYGLPISMLELNLGLLLAIFFIILMGMLLGLILIAINL